MPRNTPVVFAIIATLLSLPTGCVRSAGKVSVSGLTENVETVEQHWPDGTLRLRKKVLSASDGNVVNHGTYVRWHDHGSKEFEVSYILGKKEGTATFWHKNGRKWIEEHYVAGQRHGVRRVWDESGRQRKEEQFANGKPHGTWTTWRENGEIQWQQSFEHGVLRP